MNQKRLIFLILSILLFIFIGFGFYFGKESKVGQAEDYLAVVPKTFYLGEKGSVSLSVFDKDGQGGKAAVQLALVKDGKRILEKGAKISGNGKIEFDVPKVEEGKYEIVLSSPGFEDRAPIEIKNNFLLFLETDKPIYKPGQTIHIRVLTLNSELKPRSENVVIETLDAKGIKIFKKEVTTDEYGMANVDLPISNEPNLGTWKFIGSSGQAKNELDVKVEKYVLPKYEIKLDLAKEWFLIDEPIRGTVEAEYSFGKPVKGDLEIKALRYVGNWEVYQIYQKKIDGIASFEINSPKYVAGVPQAGGMGNVKLEISVKEQATQHSEEIDKLLTISQTPVNLQIIPESSVFKPGLPFSFLIISEAPDKTLIDAEINLNINYSDKNFQDSGTKTEKIKTEKGKAIFKITPPENCASLNLSASSGESSAFSNLIGGFSPSGNFIHLEQTSDGVPKIGEEIKFKVYSTKEAKNFYYEVLSKNRIIFSSFTNNNEISFNVSPLMAPSSKLLVYQILSNSEVAADSMPFKVEANFPQQISLEFSKKEVLPGESVEIKAKTEGRAKIGLAGVDKSVFILAERKLNLEQVFAELEKLYMAPQVELHEGEPWDIIYSSKGAKEIFDDAGVTVLSNKKIPEGEKEKQNTLVKGWGGGERDMMMMPMAAAPMAETTAETQPTSGGLAEVQRIRQYFPETWLWENFETAENGIGGIKVEAPDTITTWQLHGVGISPEKGLGVSDDELKVFQPFFLETDLPYSAIRGEEFPVKVTVYNYLSTNQEVAVEIKPDNWYELLDDSKKTVNIEGNGLGALEFKIKPKQIGLNSLNISARSKQAADAVIKKLLIEPEGVSQEDVSNFIIEPNKKISFNTFVPENIVADSSRVYAAFTANYLTQTMEGLDNLIQMPFGCGEQNMILFAPDVLITKYLEESGELKPEIMAKAEKLMITGYQRELTYRHSDGSFSAFGESDEIGSLWLTSFVLKTFSQAKDLIYIDDSILDAAKNWIISHQKSDGSFESVGFVHHEDMMGGVKGKDALTAYAAIGLIESGEKDASARAIKYLEEKISSIDDPYALAIVSYALELGNSPKKDEVYQKLMAKAKQDENGIYWGEEPKILEQENLRMPFGMPIMETSTIEPTGYAMLALTKHQDLVNAAKAGTYLLSKRNSSGGFGSTQDTVIALQALTDYSKNLKIDTNLKVNLKIEEENKKIEVNPENSDVLQIIELPMNKNIEITAEGKGKVIAQVVKKYNLPDVLKVENGNFKIKVDYNTTEVEVNNKLKITASLEFTPQIPMTAGMTVLDISIPTGFEAVEDSLAKIANQEAKIKRYEISGRKIIFFINDLKPQEKISLSFEAKALYPVKAKGVTSQVYSYYKPEMRAETLGQPVNVSEK